MMGKQREREGGGGGEEEEEEEEIEERGLMEGNESSWAWSSVMHFVVKDRPFEPT